MNEPPVALILSIMHSGTHFIKDHLLKDRPVKYHHIGEEVDDMLRKAEAEPNLLVPMRHPLATATTWKRRARPMDWMPECFELLATVVAALDVWYIPLDVSDRDSYIDAINSSLGWNMDPAGWPLIGHLPQHRTWELDEADRDILIPVLEKHSEFWMRWYPDLYNYKSPPHIVRVPRDDTLLVNQSSVESRSLLGGQKRSRTGRDGPGDSRDGVRRGSDRKPYE